MKGKIVACYFIVAFSFVFLFGCAITGEAIAEIATQSEASVEIETPLVNPPKFEKLARHLYYDTDTMVVYLGFSVDHKAAYRGYCPYYAPNGLPYKYNKETKALEEIVNE